VRNFKANFLLSIFIFLLFLEFLSRIIVKNPLYLPPPSSVLLSYISLKNYILKDIITSMIHFFIGVGSACFFGILLGIGIGWFSKIYKALFPIIEILRPIPPIAWIPMAIIWFKLTHISAGFIIFTGAFFPVLINTYTGMKDVPKILIETAKILGAKSELSLIRYVGIPYALPYIFSGIRTGMGVGWMCVVAAEIFGVSDSGIGYRLFQRFYHFHQMDYAVAYMFLLGFISLTMDAIFRKFVEDKFLKWKKGIVK